MQLKYNVQRLLRSAGLHVQKWRDPMQDLASFIDINSVEHVIDGGAYKGAKTAEFLGLFPRTTVHCFEPQEEFARHLMNRFSAEPRCKIVNAALSNQPGSATLHVAREKYTSSLMKPKAAELAVVHETKVDVLTIDQYADEHKAAPFDFIKLDLQGHEIQALEGAKSALTTCKAVLVEVNFQERYEGCSLFHEICSLLLSQGFSLFRVYSIHGYASGAWKHGDALFLKKALLKQ